MVEAPQNENAENTGNETRKMWLTGFVVTGYFVTRINDMSLGLQILAQMQSHSKVTCLQKSETPELNEIQQMALSNGNICGTSTLEVAENFRNLCDLRNKP